MICGDGSRGANQLSSDDLTIDGARKLPHRANCIDGKLSRALSEFLCIHMDEECTWTAAGYANRIAREFERTLVNERRVSHFL